MKLNISVQEVMKKNIKKVNIDESIERAAKIMQKERIGSVVVVDDERVMGIVTTSDIVYKHVAQANKGETVSDIMTTELIKINPDTTLEEAARLMVKNKIEKLLIFQDNALVGIVTNNDILRVEPALFEILLENMKIGRYNQCEICGDYSDDIIEIDGLYTCDKCRQ